jgi:hypothetical protein
MKKLTFLMLFIAWGLVANAQIARYIKTVATGTGTGLSWANAAGNADIQTMIDAVAADANKGTVYFAAGTYTPSATISIKDGVNMTGGYSADGSTRDLSQYQTILDGATNKRIIYATDANTTAAFTKITTIDGFIMQRGSSSYGSAAFITYGVVLQNCIIRNNNGSTYGAAIMAKRTLSLTNPAAGYNMSCALINCVIINNTSSNYCAGVWIDQDAHFSMINCIIANNKSTDATNGIGGLYVGANIRYSRMTNNIFYNNTSAVTATNRNNFYSATTNFAGTFSNYFSDATIPVGGVTGLGNKTSTDYVSPGFVNPTSFQGYTTNSTSITEINNSNWRLTSSSPLIGLGISTSNADLPYPYSTMASFGSTNKLYSSISTDVMGSTRVLNTNVEMGAYEYNPITITAATADAGMGSASGTTTVSKGSNVTLTATPTSGAYIFVNWTNGATVLSTNASYTFAATSTLTATANFLSFAAMTPTVTYARSANTIDVLVTNPTGYTGTITYNVLDGSDNVLATGVAKSAQASTLVYAASGLTANTSYTYKVVAVLDGSTNSQTATLNASTRKYKNGSIEVIDDFESGDLGWTGLSGGVVTSPFANPTSSGINISANVAKVSIASGQQNYSGILNSKEKIQVGPTAPYKYLHLKLKRTADNGGINLTFVARNDISQAQMEPTLISYAATMIDGTWYDYVFDLSTVDAADKTVFGFYIRPNKTTALTTASSISYIDDIYLSNSATISSANITATVNVTAGSGGTASASATYIVGDNVSLIATPNSGYRFVNWTLNTSGGAEQSTLSSYPFTVSGAKTLVANFVQQFAVAASASAGGSISSGAGTYDSGATATVVATPDAGYRFVNWTLNTSGGAEQSTLASYPFTVTGAKTLVANFVQQFAVAASASAGGSISSGAGTYDNGATATVVATPDAGYRFVNWTLNTSGGAEQSTLASYPFTVSGAKNLVANFASVAVSVPTGTSINATSLTNCTTCDVTVSGTNTVLTINDTKTINSVTATAGGKLDVAQPLIVSGAVVIEAGAKLNLSNTLSVTGDLTFKADESGSFSAKIGTGVTLDAASKVKFVKTMLDSKWYFMSFPCDVKISEITLVGGGSFVLGTDWFLKYYDGKKRADHGIGENWIAITKADLDANANLSLTANQGYIFGLKTAVDPAPHFQQLSFVLDKSIVQSAENAARPVPVKVWNAGAGTHAGWNLVGQPFLSRFVGAQVTGANAVTIPDATTGMTYTQPAMSAATFEPFSAYFIQAGADHDLSFAIEGRSLVPAAVTTDLSDRVELSITTSTGTDFTNLIMDSNNSTDYEIGQDLEKWLGTGTPKPQIYTQLNNINYAFNALPMNSVSNLRVGFYTKTAGSSIISAITSKVGSLSKLLLTDNGTSPATVTDLLTSNYTFDAAAGTDNTRFQITAQRVATDNILFGNDFTETGISIVNGKLTLANMSPSSTVRVYDAIGHMVINKIAIGNTMEIKVPVDGFYSINILNDNRSWSIKVLIKK